MSDTLTRENVETRCANVNRRLESRGADVHWEVQARSGHMALDRFRNSDGACMAVIMVGTKREVADFLHAAMVALDDAVLGA